MGAIPEMVEVKVGRMVLVVPCGVLTRLQIFLIQ